MVTITFTAYFKNGDTEDMTVSDGNVLIKYIMELIDSPQVEGIYVHGVYGRILMEEDE